MKSFLVCLLFLTACASSPNKSNENADSKMQGLSVAPTTENTPASSANSNAHLNRYISRNTVRGIDFGATIHKVAFASDADQNAPQPIWKNMEAAQPDLFLFLGNNVLSDTEDQKTLADRYRQLDQIPEYKSFRMKVPFMAIWDEEDMGQDDADSTYAGKEAAKNDFLNYWSYVRNSLPMDQLQKGGLFHAKSIGPKNKIVQVIMLDTRYYRNTAKAGEKDSKNILLGEEQWRFLEKQLRQKANLRLIVSHLPAVADTDGKLPSWNNFARERDRFFELLRKTGARNVVVLSGDDSQWRVAKQEIKGWGTLYNVIPGPLNAEPTDAGGNPSSFGLATIDWNHGIVKFELRGIDDKVINTFDLRLRK